MTCQCLKDRRIGDLETLRNGIASWSTDLNTRQRGVDWRMKIAVARGKLTLVYSKTLLWQGTSQAAADAPLRS